MKFKAQKSLEMIIGLIILLVVAGVVINIFLSQFEEGKITGITGNLQCENQKNKFKSQCEALCSEYKVSKNTVDAVKYCEKNTALDWNCDGDEPDTVAATSEDLKLQMCEDKIYCFNVYTCKGSGWKLGYEDCKEKMCRVYTNTYSEHIAGQKIKEVIKAGTCTLPDNDIENWHRRFGFASDDPCGS